MINQEGPRVGPEFDPDFEAPSEEDIARFGGDTFDCPSCKNEVHHDAPMCPRCGRAFTDDDGRDLPEDAAGGGRFVIVIACAVVAAILFVSLSAVFSLF